MFTFNNNEDLTQDNNNIFLSEVISMVVMEDEELTDNMKLHILTDM